MSDKPINLKLKSIDAHFAVYQMSIEGSEAYYTFSIPLVDFENFNTNERFINSVHRGVRLLKQFDPEYNADEIQKIFDLANTLVGNAPKPEVIERSYAN